MTDTTIAATTPADGGWQRGDWMQTFRGRQFYPLSPRPQDVDPLDIAHALSMLCRYNGQVDRFYSVAEHCWLMSQVMPTPELALEALLHDASEAYCGDMVRPLKHTDEMKPYRDAEDAVMLAIADRFGLPTAVVSAEADGLTPDMGGAVKRAHLKHPTVQDADTRILLTERTALMQHYKPSDRWFVDGMEPLDVLVRGWEPRAAESAFLNRLVELGASLTDQCSHSDGDARCWHFGDREGRDG